MTEDRSNKSKKQNRAIRLGGVSSIIGNLEKEVNTLLSQRASHESRMASLLDKLSDESAIRTGMEVRIKLMEDQVASAENLRRKAVVALRDKKRICRAIEEIQTRLDTVTEERNALIKRAAATDGLRKKLRTVEAEARRLRAGVADTNRLSDKLHHVEQERDALDEQVRDLTRNLAESQNLGNTMKLNLDSTRQMVRDMYSRQKAGDSQIQLLRKKLSDACAKLSQTQKDLASQTVANKHLACEMRILTEEHEVACRDRDTANEMYQHLRDGAMRVIEQTRVEEHDDMQQELPYVNSLVASDAGHEDRVC